MIILLLVSTSSRLRLRLRKFMSSPTSHNFEIPGFVFHPSRLTLPSHASNLFLSKGNPYNLNVLLLLEHPQAEQQGIICYTAWRRFNLDRKWRPHPSTNQKSVRQWPNSIHGLICNGLLSPPLVALRERRSWLQRSRAQKRYSHFRSASHWDGVAEHRFERILAVNKTV